MANNDGITEAQASERLADWRMVAHRAHLTIDCGDFVQAMAFVNAVADLAEAANHHPEIDIRWSRVHLAMSSHDVGGMSERDVELGTKIADLARERGHDVDVTRLAETQIAIDVRDMAAVLPFWKAVYAYEQVGDNHLKDPEKVGPTIWFQETTEERAERNNLHIDVDVPHDEVEVRLKAVLDAGGRLVTDEFAPAWWVLADPEGNEACLCTWRNRD
ncbi:4a-hydroxytetrahydrobiopterin dehydratase [Mariniluteicoccus flavus]